MSAGLPLPDPEALAALKSAGVAAPLAERLAIYAALVLNAIFWLSLLISIPFSCELRLQQDGYLPL